MKIHTHSGLKTLCLAVAMTSLFTASPKAGAQELPWDMEALSKAPVMHAVETKEPGVRAFFYDSVSWRGRPTRIFAYYGAPAHTEGQKVPAMVLVHGGSGSAYAEWVRQWNRRGYAAIAMDHFGGIPAVAPPGQPYRVSPARNPDGGPTGNGGFSQVDEPIKDQWTYQAVAAAILANSLLRSFPEVDKDKIGLTGISWGGYLACIIPAVDERFRFAVPVYGSGFLNEDSAWLSTFAGMGPERTAKWAKLWDPSQYLPRVRMPLLFISGTNDPAFPLGSWQKSAVLPRHSTLSLHVRMPHGQYEGATPAEIGAFADAIVTGGQPLATIERPKPPTLGRAQITFNAASPIKKAELMFTRDGGPWKDRRWESSPATLTAQTAGMATAALPPETQAFFFTLTDERGLLTTSECQSVTSQ